MLWQKQINKDNKLTVVLDLIRKALDDCFEFSIIVYYFTASLILNLLQKNFSEQVCVRVTSEIS